MAPTVTKYFLNITRNSFPNIDFSKGHLILPESMHYYADPFLFEHKEKLYIFFEDWDYYKGVIKCGTYTEAEGLIGVETCLELPRHTSFPNIFRYQSQIWMIPDTSVQNNIQLFKCEEFPHKWKFEKILVSGFSTADTAFFADNSGRVWLFTQSDSQTMALFSASSIFDMFTKTLINVNHPRSAGTIFRYGEAIYRPAQDCSEQYGKAVKINKITKLGPQEYEERLVQTYDAGWFPELTGCHTFNLCGDFVITDGRLRVESPYAECVRSTIGSVQKSTDNDAYVEEYISKLIEEANRNGRCSTQ